MTKKTAQKTIPSMEDIISYLQKQSRPVRKKELCQHFGIKGDNRIKLKNMLREMNSKGIFRTERKGQKIIMPGVLVDRIALEITGKDSDNNFVARPFVWTLDMPAPQVILTQGKTPISIVIGDVVQAKITPLGNNKYNGKILRKLSMFENRFIGVYQNGKVYSVDRRFKQSFDLVGIPDNYSPKNQDLVVAEISPVRVKNPKATFIKCFGSTKDPFALTLIAIYLHSLPIAFTEQAEKQAQRLKVPPLNEHRVDLRKIPFVTIDGEDARDFDDAVWAEPDKDPKNPKGWHLMVAIADVSWYVRPGTALDHDAKLRGNSVYFPDRVLPMLPFELSNGVCSLNPQEDRGALVCEIWLDKNGHKRHHQFMRALIRSVRRLTYNEVQDAIDEKTPIRGLEDEIRSLEKVYRLLDQNRQKRGVLELDIPERVILLTKTGQVSKIKLRERLPSMQLIEEFMILANVAAAETLEEHQVMAMYRVHDRPSSEKLENLSNFLSVIHQDIPVTENLTAQNFNEILSRVHGKGVEKAVNELILRSQSQACYSPENIGHFGLSLARYTHFTSPIRRYADLLVHRALVKALHLGEGELTSEEEASFEEIAQHISATERQAAGAEMDASDRYLAAFMEDRIGETFLGYITSVTNFGLFVSVEEFNAEGFIPFRSLTGDYFDYEGEKNRLVGRSTGKTYVMGDKVKVILKECIPLTGGLLFHIK